MRLAISIAMCTFNGSQFLPDQLRSIAVQRRPPDELVICDDGSSDISVAIAQDFARKAPFAVRIICNEGTLGSTRNFEQAISLCQGSIIALADQDDLWYPHKLAQIERTFLASQETVAVFSDADMVDSNAQPLGVRLWSSFLFTPRQQRQVANGEALKVLIKHPVVTGATMAFRSEFRDLLFPIPAKHVHDRWISFLLAARGRFAMIREPLMQYRRHYLQQIGPGQATLRGRFEQARKTGAPFYLEEVQVFRELAEHLQQRAGSFPHAQFALDELGKKISHREHRARLPHSSVARIHRIMRETLNGNYFRYSEGWQSIAKDIAGTFSPAADESSTSTRKALQQP